MTLKRKKWTEEEERSLIDKYAEMQSDGILGRMRTREKKFRPIAGHVNAGHHAVNPDTYPFLWSWKDASTKAQNMRHQYLLVKQKLLSSSSTDDVNWSRGISLWPNFLHYRQVFGDAFLPLKPPDPPAAIGPLVSAADVDGELALALGFDCSDGDDGFDYEDTGPLPPPPLPPPSKRRKKKKRRRREAREWGKIAAALSGLREREERLEERERERVRIVQEQEETERKRREAEEGERWVRREEEEREWKGRIERRRAEWRKRIEAMMGQHRAEMEQIQGRMLHEQQAVVNHLLGIISHWAATSGGGGGIADAAAICGNNVAGGQQYVSQMMQGMNHVNVMIPGENRVGSDGSEDQFIVDG